MKRGILDSQGLSCMVGKQLEK